MGFDDYRALEQLLEEDGATVVDALDRHAGSRDTQVAVTYGETGEQRMYGELARRTDSIAGNLAASGVAPGSFVGVLTTNPLLSTEMMFGAWKCGAIYAPVNYLYAGSMLAYTLNDSAPVTLVVDAGLVGAVADVWPQLTHHPNIVLFGATDAISAADAAGATGTTATPFEVTPFEALLSQAERPRVRIEAQTPCSLVYTSGTTGPSKGVLQPHRWITQYTWPYRRRLTDEDVLYNDLPMYHVGGAYTNVVVALWVGAQVVLWNRFSPNDFWDRIREHGCTAALLLDVMIPWLLGQPASDRDRLNSLNKVHMQPLPLRHREFAERFGIDIVTAGFGQTESGTTIHMILEECAEGEGTPQELYRGKSRQQLREESAAAGVTVLDGREVTRKAATGRPLPFFEVAILDERDRPCPLGTPGHLGIRGKLPHVLFSEYVGKPEKTVEATRNLWFHTGDLVVQDGEGLFYFLDRLGDRIRVRGENVSSVHVEEILQSHPGIEVCAVVGVPSTRSDEDEIIAFVQPVEGASLTVEELRVHAEDTMPRFMRPYAYRIVPEIPRTPTNKLEKHKLRAMLAEETA